MIFDSLNIAASSLKAQQKAIDVVSHNIANVNTKGYSRQTASLETATSEQINGLSLGRGIDVASVQRIVDPIISKAQLNNGSQLSFWTTVNGGLQAVENVFGSLQSTGLASSLDDFFLSWKQLANNPQDNGQRVNVRAKSTSLVGLLDNMQQQLRAVQVNTDGNIDQALTSANQVLDNIASLTTQINRRETGTQGSAGLANDLRDQREQAVRDLAKLIPIQDISRGNGSFMLQTLNGNLLSQDGISRQLGRGAVDASGFSSVVIKGTNFSISKDIQGGEIGGMIELRDNKLSTYLTELDSIAANLIFSVNQIHASSSNPSRHSSLTGEQSSNPTLALNDVTQTAPFAAKVQPGSFKVHVFDATGAPVSGGGSTISILAGSSMNSVAASLNGVAGITASVNGNGQLVMGTTTAGQTFALSDDSSNFLAAYEVNNFFHGADAASLSLSAAVLTSANAINTSRADPLTSVVQAGDSRSALAILALQDVALSVDGSASSSLHNRTTSLSTLYGSDVAITTQQKSFRTVEAASLENQRQAVSGVNIDEELISMIKFQRAYEASAKVITTTNKMLDSLLSLIR